MVKAVLSHLKQYWMIYLTLTSVLLAGIIFGAVGVKALGNEKVSVLTEFLNQLLTEQPKTIETSFLQQLARDNFLIMAGIWLLGLTIVGTPLVYLIVFTRGFIIGFTIAFVIKAQKFAGICLALVSIFLPSVLAIPCLLLGAGLATIFSFLLLKGKNRGDSMGREFLYYCMTSLLVSLGAVIAGVMQGYFSVLGVRLLGY
ncbi:stage II sporulation protein M [Syntrophobotulus glycolicus DSM 8271]|uniref:Stage II sporulation protein M n=1 Tax=Syntrophobotulus glycolicus (strain DSM 8271 / FlGlyR) TaxID=645991 RepID=F0T082_SYNGF|nr:stage II sporulation protein M [Syntrophobotulus glycolicus]ADY56169.1 stage II sporulation protein M [Syntrophobotulus glycolicus DSM 8271]